MGQRNATIPAQAEALGYASEEEQESMISEFRRSFDMLTPEARRKLIPVFEWLVNDRRPETDPRVGDPWWADFPGAPA